MSVLSEKMSGLAPRMVMFDPTLKDHLRAYYSTKYLGKQDPTLRFFLEKPFASIPAMMEHKISQELLKKELSPMLDYSYAEL